MTHSYTTSWDLTVGACLFSESRLGSQRVLCAPGSSMFNRERRVHEVRRRCATTYIRRGAFMLRRMSAAVL